MMTDEFATDDAGERIRFSRHHACGAIVQWELQWRINHVRENSNAPTYGNWWPRLVAEQCPGCAAQVRFRHLISFAEMDRRIDSLMIQERPPMGVELFAAINALVERGEDFERVALLFDRTADELREEIAAFAAQPNLTDEIEPKEEADLSLQGGLGESDAGCSGGLAGEAQRSEPLDPVPHGDEHGPGHGNGHVEPERGDDIVRRGWAA